MVLNPGGASDTRLTDGRRPGSVGTEPSSLGVPVWHNYESWARPGSLRLWTPADLTAKTTVAHVNSAAPQWRIRYTLAAQTPDPC